MAVTTVTFRQGPEANLPTLAAGEPGYCTDTNNVYVGTPSGINRRLLDASEAPEEAEPPIDENELVYAIEAGQSVAVNDIVHLLNGTLRKTVNFTGDPMTITANTFQAASTTQISAAVLHPLRLAIAYRGSDTKGYVVLADIGAETVRFSTPFVCNAADTPIIEIAALSENKIALAYKNGTINQVRAGSITGNVITFGTAVTTHNPGAQTSITAFNENQIAICSTSATTLLGTAFIGTITGTTIALATGASVSGQSYATNPVIKKLSATKIVAIGSYTNTYRMIVGTVAVNNTITWDTAYTQISTDNITERPSMVVLDASRVLVSYVTTAAVVKAKIITISGSTITLGTEYTLSASGGKHIHSLALSDTSVLFVYAQSGAGTAVRQGTNLFVGSYYAASVNPLPSITGASYTNAIPAAWVDNNDGTGSQSSSSNTNFCYRLPNIGNVSIFRIRCTGPQTATFYDVAGVQIGTTFAIAANDSAYKVVNYANVKYINLYGNGTVSDYWASSEGAPVSVPDTTQLLLASVSGAVITLLGTAATPVRTGMTTYNHLVRLDNKRYGLMYADATTGHGEAISFYEDQQQFFAGLDSDYFGFAVKAINGTDATVKPVGVLGDFAGLVQNQRYYWQLDGTLGVNKTNYLAGIAIDDTTMRLFLKRT